MSKKRIFDIDFPDALGEDEAALAGTGRRGPMASAISENADALQERNEKAKAIRAENDALAQEHVRLKRLGLLVDLVPLQDVKTTKLARDRSKDRDDELDELKVSIQAIGLSNPIQVEVTEDGYELIQGFRRLCAFRELFKETGDQKFASIPAALVASGEALERLYRRMVDENLVRRDISFAEMATLAQRYADDDRTEASSVAEAIAHLYPSAGRQKRNYIGHFASLMTYLEGHLSFPESIPRALGLDVEKRLSEKAERIGWLRALLIERQPKTPREEVLVLRDYVASLSAPGKKAKRGKSRAGAKTTLRYNGPGGLVRCLASDGRIELRAERDFSILDRRQIEAGLDAFFKALDGES
ncbi:MAG: ParB N-terminal domain-containing protein [Boseongicola sp.]|nr:ParB N-terminal domain-containing protein [Boseongicola sp.]NNJ68497.1 ParB N-terminal domain-containing protein [Boseongicola sp.]